MAKGKKGFEEHKEHKLREKGIIISPRDILKALNKFAEILPDSGPEELTIVKSKIASQREKLETLELLKKGGEKTISSLEQEIGTIQSEILGLIIKRQISFF